MQTIKVLLPTLLLIVLNTTLAQAATPSWKELNTKATSDYRQQFITAEDYAKDAIAIARKSGNQEELATSLNNLALISTHLQWFPEAEALNKESIAVRQSTFGIDDPKVAVDWQRFGAHLFFK